MSLRGYDAWKTQSPDDERYDDEEEHWQPCHHSRIRWSMWTGQGTCLECGDSYPEWSMTIRNRVRHAWLEFRWWWKWTALYEIKRPFRAVRRWWRGDRKAPWRPDDEVPF